MTSDDLPHQVRVSCDRTELDTKCLDNDDGTYKVLWFSKMGGAYNLRDPFAFCSFAFSD